MNANQQWMKVAEHLRFSPARVDGGQSLPPATHVLFEGRRADDTPVFWAIASVLVQDGAGRVIDRSDVPAVIEAASVEEAWSRYDAAIQAAGEAEKQRMQASLRRAQLSLPPGSGL